MGLLGLGLASVASGPAAETAAAPTAFARLDPTAPGWRELIAAFAHLPDTAAAFTEQRTFSFKSTAVVLAGEVRISSACGLSLHYTAPTVRTVILDDRGMLLRTPDGDLAPPADPRAAGVNSALRHIVRLDLPALEKDFELTGRRDGSAWSLALVPRTEALLRQVGRIAVAGEAATIRRIEFRPGAKQAIEILIAPPRPPAPFTAAELKTFFR